MSENSSRNGVSIVVTPPGIRAQHEVGSALHVPNGHVVCVEHGVVRSTAVHVDGHVTVLGFHGPGRVLDRCDAGEHGVVLEAHTDVVVRAVTLAAVWDEPAMRDGLLARLRTAEAWSAAQGNPTLEQRLLGVLRVLAGQFGRSTPHGYEIDLTVRQWQLAACVGASRPAVSRALSRLQRRGELCMRGDVRHRRFALPVDRSRVALEHATPAGETA